MEKNQKTDESGNASLRIQGDSGHQKEVAPELQEEHDADDLVHNQQVEDNDDAAAEQDMDELAHRQDKKPSIDNDNENDVDDLLHGISNSRNLYFLQC